MYLQLTWTLAVGIVALIAGAIGMRKCLKLMESHCFFEEVGLIATIYSMLFGWLAGTGFVLIGVSLIGWAII